MRKYENLLLLSPELSAEERQAVLGNLTAIIEREGGKILEMDEWGMRDLAYAVNKMDRGYYVLINSVMPAAAVAELERNIRITDGIFKFVTVKLEDAEEVA